MTEADKLKWLIRQVLNSLPTKRDWLDPDIEREMRLLSDREPRVDVARIEGQQTFCQLHRVWDWCGSR